MVVHLFYPLDCPIRAIQNYFSDVTNNIQITNPINFKTFYEGININHFQSTLWKTGAQLFSINFIWFLIPYKLVANIIQCTSKGLVWTWQRNEKNDLILVLLEFLNLQFCVNNNLFEVTLCSIHFKVKLQWSNSLLREVESFS